MEQAPETLTITVARGRSIVYGTTHAPAEFRTGSDGRREMVAPPVTSERVYLPGETLTFPRSEAEHLIAAGFAIPPGGEPIFDVSGPLLRAEAEERGEAF